MLNSILNAVTKQLGTTFGDSYHYYMEDVEQRLTRPCFMVKLLTPLQRSKSPVLYDRTMPIVVHYFGDSKTELNKECYDIGERIVECLEYLPFNGCLIRGEDISWQRVEDVLQVFVTYKFTTTTATPTEDVISEFTTNVINTN